MADEIRATPRNSLAALLSDAINSGVGYMKDPRRTQQLQGLGRLIESTGIPATVENLSYDPSGRGLFTGAGGLGGTTRMRPEALEAAMNIAPMVGPTAKLAGRGMMAAGKAGEQYAEKVVPQIMSRGGLPAELLQGMSRGTVSPLDVYHGTPHTLPPTPKNPLGEFDASKIGTGEGAQAYGHGIYTAENPLVAKDYQFMEQNWFDTSQATYKGKSIDYWYNKAQKDRDLAFRTKNKVLEQDANARLAYWENIMTHNHPEGVLKSMTDPTFGWDEATNYAKSIDLTKFKGIPRSGNLYKVDLPDQQIEKMLDWDKPLTEQSQFIQDAMKKIGMPLNKTGREAYEGVTYEMGRQKGSTRSTVIPMNPKEASNFLQQQGVVGIKYLDQFSRETGEGTRNFVTFPGQEKSMRILERNGETVASPFYQDPFPDTAR
jgi:hypothetical protein